MHVIFKLVIRIMLANFQKNLYGSDGAQGTVTCLLRDRGNEIRRILKLIAGSFQCLFMSFFSKARSYRVLTVDIKGLIKEG